MLTNHQPDTVYISDTVLKIAISKAQKAGTVLIRSHGSRYRMLDERMNPLVNLTGAHFRKLTDSTILKYRTGSLYDFNKAIKIES